MGVSEHPVEINTRMVLERGLNISGTSRSGIKDFEKTITFLASHPNLKRRYENLIGIERTVTTIAEIHKFLKLIELILGEKQ